MMTRTALHNSSAGLKNISGQSIGDFIRTLRLKKAVQIMMHEDVSLTEVMYRIGIQTNRTLPKRLKKNLAKRPRSLCRK